jgi:nucleoside-diphosphate-sugar epimerase
METVLVTGAAGTVGHYVVGLAEAAGYRVIANDLSANGMAVPVRGEVRPGDIRDRAFLEKLVKGVRHVIHTAALLDVGTPFETLWAVNTEAVVSLYDAAARAGVERFVHVSTAMIYGVGQKGPLTEESPTLPRGPHGRSKYEAERALIERAGRGGPAWTILRAAPVYGRRGRHFAASLLVVGPVLRLITPVLPRARSGPIATFVHAEDVARALLFVLPRAETHGQIYNVADEDPLALGDRLTETYRAYGLPSVPVGQLPRRVLDRIGRFFQTDPAYQVLDRTFLAAWKLVVLRHRLKPALRARLDREAITLLYDDLVVDTSKLRALGWRPRFPLFMDGWRQVLRWYQAERWVPRYA